MLLFSGKGEFSRDLLVVDVEGGEEELFVVVAVEEEGNMGSGLNTDTEDSDGSREGSGGLLSDVCILCRKYRSNSVSFPLC